MYMNYLPVVTDTITECRPQQHQSKNPSLKMYNLPQLPVYYHK